MQVDMYIRWTTHASKNEINSLDTNVEILSSLKASD